MSFEINLLPDNVYVSIINYLTVNDIEHLSESGLDNRTEMAYDNLEHVLIYERDCFRQAEQIDLDYWYSKLPKTIKTIEVCDAVDKWMLIGELRVRFPNLVAIPDVFRSSYEPSYEYLKFVSFIPGGRTKLTFINATTSEPRVDYGSNMVGVLEASPELKKLMFNAHAFYIIADSLIKCTKLDSLAIIFDVIELNGGYELLQDTIVKLQSLKLLKLGPCVGNSPFHDFVEFCTKQSYKTELRVNDRVMSTLMSQFAYLVNEIHRLNTWTTKLMNLSNVRRLKIKSIQSDDVLLLAPLCVPEFMTKLDDIKIVSYLFTAASIAWFTTFIRTRGHHIKKLNISVENCCSELINILANENPDIRLKSCEILVTNEDAERTLTKDDVYRMFSISVDKVINVSTPSNYFKNLLKESAKTVTIRKCRIVHESESDLDDDDM